MSRAESNAVIGVITFAGFVFGFVAALLVFAVTGTDRRGTYAELCRDVFHAELVWEMSACVDGDTIVHRFGEDQ